MTELITQSSNPTLWNTLDSAYDSIRKPSHVWCTGKQYRVHILTSEDIAFEEIDIIDYIDSRSITGSKKASYKKLDQ